MKLAENYLKLVFSVIVVILLRTEVNARTSKMYKMDFRKQNNLINSLLYPSAELFEFRSSGFRFRKPDKIIMKNHLCDHVSSSYALCRLSCEPRSIFLLRMGCSLLNQPIPCIVYIHRGSKTVVRLLIALNNMTVLVIVSNPQFITYLNSHFNTSLPHADNFFERQNLILL